MFRQAILRSFLWLVTLCAILIIGIISCGGDDDENDWVGTWAMETVDGQGVEQSFEEIFGEEINISIITNDWMFNDDGTVEAEFAMKFEVTEQGLEISGEGSMKMMGTYSLSGSSYTLTPTEVEGTGLFEGEVVGPTDENTGTWSRSGNTLTLNSDDGSTTVFKKK